MTKEDKGMPYIKEVCMCGKVKEVYKYHTYRYNSKKRPRNEKQNKTSECQQKVNQRKAQKHLRRIINNNFVDGDLFLTLTYNDVSVSSECAKKSMANFLRRLKYCYNKFGQPLKYIAVTEYKNKRIHHHIIINNVSDVDIKTINDLWGVGYVRCTVLNSKGDYSKLAEYLIKETSKTYNQPDRIYAKRWNQSQNLVMPEVKKSIIRSETWNRLPAKQTNGYILMPESVQSGFTDDGYPFMFYAMIKIE